MKDKEIIEMANEAYQQGFRDGFEYGSGKKSPYAQDSLANAIAKALADRTGSKDITTQAVLDGAVVAECVQLAVKRANRIGRSKINSLT